MKRILILAPHHDDAEFGLGGFIARTTHHKRAELLRVSVFFGGDYIRSDGNFVDGRVRERESGDALAHLGAIDLGFLNVGAENSGQQLLSALAYGVEREMHDTQPTDVFVCMPSFNQDHVALYDAARIAFRPARQSANLWGYTYPGNVWGPALPEVGKMYLPFEGWEASRKYAALRMHRSQFEGRKGGVDPNAAVIYDSQHGVEAGCEAAELVYLLKGSM